MNRQKVNEVLVAQTGGCRICIWYGLVDPYDIQVTSITSIEEGWLAEGRGQIVEKKTCPKCGVIYDAILHAIPIHCESFSCPGCGKSGDIKYKVNSIKTEIDSFKFEASLICKKCSQKKTFRKTLKKFLEIIKIEIKPTGITLKKS
jgi:hypothetical protein